MEATDTTVTHDPAGWSNPDLYKDDAGQFVATCGACGHTAAGPWPKDAADALAPHITAAIAADAAR